MPAASVAMMAIAAIVVISMLDTMLCLALLAESCRACLFILAIKETMTGAFVNTTKDSYGT